MLNSPISITIAWSILRSDWLEPDVVILQSNGIINHQHCRAYTDGSFILLKLSTETKLVKKLIMMLTLVGEKNGYPKT